MQNINTLEHRKLQVSVGGGVIMISFAMLFATLFLGYAIYRFSHPVWPPQGFQNISVFWPSISTAVIAISSIFLEWSYAAFEKGELKVFKKFWYLTLSLGLAFVLSQFFVWNSLNFIGVYYNSGILGSILHGFTWIHAAHVILGIISLLFLFPVTRLNHYQESFVPKFLLIKKFWHFLGVVWLLMYIGLFLV